MSGDLGRPDDPLGFVAALFDSGMAAPAGLRTWNGSDPARRFAIHRNNMLSSLLELLAGVFPVTVALVGEQFFQTMALAWIRSSPPATPVLGEYGGAFPDFIARFAPARALPYLADVARLEWLRNQCWHAADAPVLDADDFRPWLARSDKLDSLRLRLHPACAWLRSPHPVASIWLAHQGQGQLDALEPGRAEDVLICRPLLELRVLQLPPGGADFLEALKDGACLAEAAALGAGVDGFDLSANLRGLLDHGLACAFLDSAATAL